jgi:hypothetical protein
MNNQILNTMKNNNLKHFFVILSVAIMSMSMQAQDLIVTNEGDSLNCKISKIKTDNIYFTFKHKEEIRSTLLPLDQVKFHQYNFYQQSEVPAAKIIGNQIYPHFRAAINGGCSYRLAKISPSIPPDFEQYMKDLKSGYQYGMDLSYYFTEQLGFGLKYNRHKSKNEINNIYVVQPDGTTKYGMMSDDISIDFIGPFFGTRLLNASKRNSFIVNFSIGYLGYTNEAVLFTDFTIKSSTVGLCWDIGYDIGLSENFALGIQLSYMLGTLTQYDLSYGGTTEKIKLEKDSYENLSRIDLSIGLRLTK